MSSWGLILGAVGAVAGSFVPGIGTAAGASYGWAIGSAIGGAIDANAQRPGIEGPKLSDLSIQVSTYGGMVPIHFGTVGGIVGMPIDLDVITVHSDKNYVKAQKAYVTTYTYSTSVAIMLGEGVCLGIRRIWLDGKLWYSAADDVDAETMVASSVNLTWFAGMLATAASGMSLANGPTFAFYPGSETQLPDPTLEAMHGVGNVPAYRGTAYVVFSNSTEILNGNSLRQLKFELVYSGAEGIAAKKWVKGPATVGSAGAGPQSFIPSDNDEFFYMKQLSYTPLEMGVSFAAAYEIWSITPTAQTFIRRFQVPDQAYTYGASAGSADEIGHLRPWVTAFTYVFQGVYRWILPDDFIPDALDESFNGSFFNFITGTDFVAFNPVNTLAFSKQGKYMLLLGAYAATPGTFVQVKLFTFTENRSSPSDIESFGNIQATRDFTADLAVGETITAVVLATSCAWVISFDSTTSTNVFRKCSLTDLSTLATITYGISALIPGGIGEAYGNLFQGLAELCLAGDDFYIRTNVGNAPFGHYVLKVDALGVIGIEGSDGLSVSLPPSGTAIGPDVSAAQVDLYGSAFGYNPSTHVATFMANENVSPDFLIWPYSVNLRALTPGECTAAEVVSYISQRVGYSPSQLDVTQIPDPLLGYSLASVAPGRSGIEPVLKYAYADAVDSDGKTKYVKRGGSPVFTVNFDDLCAHEEGAQMPEPFPLARTQEVALPSKVTVNFRNPLADYETGSEPSPQRSTISQNPVVDEVPIVMLPQKAAELASVLYFDQIIQRVPRSFWVLKKFDYVEPTDTGWVEYPRGTFNLVRVVKREENGPVLKFDCVPEDADAYTPNAVSSSVGTGQTGIALIAPSLLMPLDIPILRDSDDNAGLYAAISSPVGIVAILYRSADDLDYTEVGYVENSATMGFTTTALGEWTGGNVFDEVNFVDVSVSGVLNSATSEAIIADATLNACAIGLPGAQELIQFRSAVLLSAGKYRLSGLLRGRRGTEWATGLHTATDRFVVLGTVGTLRINEGASAIGALRYYKPVSVGRSLAQTYAQQFTNTAVGLEPLSPVNLRWGVNAAGDYLIYAQRRSRLQNRQGFLWDLPIGETAELYDLDVFSDAGYATLKRTFSNETAFPITYTTAMQTADFGVAATGFFLKLYPLSATVGRGYPLAYALSNIPFRGSWNPGDVYIQAGAQWLLSNLDSTALKSGAGLATVIRAGQSAGTGKRYFELAIDAVIASNGIEIGLCTSNATLSFSMTSANGATARILLMNPQGTWNYWNGSGNSGANIPAAAFTTGDVIAFVIDFDSGKAWMYKNNVSVQGDAVAGTSPIWTFTASTVLFPFFSAPSTADLQQVSIRLSAQSQTYPLPTGYSAFIP